MLLHHLLSTQTLTLLHPIPDDEQLLCLQLEHLQITGSLNFLKEHIATLKGSGKFKPHITNIPTPAVKIGLNLWEFPKGNAPAMFPVFRKNMIIAGRIHIWNSFTEMYERDMVQTKEKRVYKMYCGNEETYYSAAGVEFFNFTSIYH